MVAPRDSTGTMRQVPRGRGDIRFIENRDRRQVTFSKYKKALFKMALELSREYGARVAAVVFSPAGNTFAFGAPLLDGGAIDDDDREAVEAAARRASEARVSLAAEEKARMDAAGKNVLLAAAPGGGRFWWEADVETLGEDELRVFARALRRLRNNVRRRAENLQQLAADSQPQPTTQHQCLQLQ